MQQILLLFLAVLMPPSQANSTEYWLGRREALIDDVFGRGAGVLSSKSIPDQVIDYSADTPGLQALVWNMTTRFEISSTVFYSPVTPGKRSTDAFFFHHGHSDCACPTLSSNTQSLAYRKCQPGCNSSMPTKAEIGMSGYSWWDLYNVSDFAHSLGFDVFILSMPLKGVNLGPGSTASAANGDHWWFLQWEQQGDHPLRYFIEPVVLTANYAKAQGYDQIHMAGLSGGGWSTTFAPAVDKRIQTSFPIAGSVPCAMRNPLGKVPNQTWTGSDAEDYEQSCMPLDTPPGSGDNNPGRPAFSTCNYTCQYLLAGLEPGRFQVQILHEYDTCCFSPLTRHDQMLNYEANVRAELMAGDRSEAGHGWFTSTANEHHKHEVSAQDKTLIVAALKGRYSPGSQEWERLECDILHQPAPGGACAPNIEPGL
eukprot:TRINITY_DN3545_c0_g1_i2.p1 TRINITY_DN3545_c0_g1~~TRINITY_DN3545_c0_g1_i2.p1  ORF type:complete len:424 (+),score=79.11 TRINITY_DN3545_c0_g1_i2:37-1308(+)